MFSAHLLDKATRLLEDCRQRNTHLITAESCTGGLIGGLLTEIAGSSDVVEGGYIVYSNHAKMLSLGVEDTTLKTYGAVSHNTAHEMAEGALIHHPRETPTDNYLSIAVTGVAGPGGGSKDKPVGTVWFGCTALLVQSSTAHTDTEKCIFPGDRAAVRLQTVEKSIDILHAALLSRI